MVVFVVNKMKKNLIRVISIIVILYSVWIFYAGTIFIVKAVPVFNNIQMTLEQRYQVNSVTGYVGLIVVVGIIGIISGIALFLMKNWGFYLVLLDILFLWGLSYGRVNGIKDDWISLLIATIIFFGLIFIRLFIKKEEGSNLIFSNLNK